MLSLLRRLLRRDSMYRPRLDGSVRQVSDDGQCLGVLQVVDSAKSRARSVKRRRCSESVSESAF